jgi:HD-like signal output (HDOD) protein
MYLKKLNTIDSLPVLPEVVVRLQTLLSSNRGSANDLAQLIEQDLSLSASVLKVANSALFNYSGRRIVNLRDAIVRIGREELLRILLAVSVISSFPHSDLLDLRVLWQRSFVAASLATKLERVSSLAFLETDSIAVAALFHDVGQLLLACYFPQELDCIAEEMERNSLDFATAEKLVMKSQLHAELGGLLLEKWRLSADVAIPVRFHESPDLAPAHYRSVVHIINCADHLIDLVLPFSLSKPLGSDEINTVLTQNGIAHDRLDELIQFIHLEGDKALTLLSMWGMGDSMNKLRSTGNTSLLRPV